jgi:hypothetical protein
MARHQYLDQIPSYPIILLNLLPNLLYVFCLVTCIHALISFNMTIKIRIYNRIVIPPSFNIIRKLHLLVKIEFWQHLYLQRARVRVMVFNATINKIAVKSWRSVLLVGETGMPGDNQRPAESHWKLYHIVSYRVHLAWGFKLTTLVVIWTDCIVSYKYNHHHMIRTTKAP